MDLDAAEAANPGTFVAQPLVIDVQAVTDGTAADAAVSLRARLERK